MEDDLQKQLDKAAIKGVARLLKDDDVESVIEMMKRGMVPKAVFDSAVVTKAATDLMIRVFNLNDNDRDYVVLMEEAMSILQIPKEVIGQTVVKYFEKFSKVRFPPNFYLILGCFDLPKEMLGSEALLKIITYQIKLEVFEREIDLGRLYYFLRYFPIPAELMPELVTKAVLVFALRDDNEVLIDEIISCSGLSAEEVTKQVVTAIGILSVNEAIREIVKVKKKFKPPEYLIDSQSLKKMAVQVMHSYYFQGHGWFVKNFGLTKEDLSEADILWWMKVYLVSGEIDKAEEFAKFAGIPNETITLLIRENLSRIVRNGRNKTYYLTDKYGILQSEVIKVVEDLVVESLGSRTSVTHPNYWIVEFQLPKEFLFSARVMNAAKKTLVKAYTDGDIREIYWLKKTFAL